MAERKGTMIESCPQKRMVFGIGLLVLLTILVLIFESRWTGNSPRGQQQFVIENNSTCWLREQFVVVQDCHPCTAFEIASKSKGVCVHTHNKELLKCQPSGETVSRSCDKVAWVDERNFWTFEGTLFTIGVLSTTVSLFRQRILDRRTTLKIQRQLGQTV